MPRFQVQPDKSINTPKGERARVVMVQAFPNLLVTDETSRADWNLRGSTSDNTGITPATGKSLPTGVAKYSWRNPGHIAALIASYHEKGFRGIRTGVDPAMLNTTPYTDPADGRTYPSDLEMLDTIISVASDYGWMINLTMACSFAPTTTVSTFLTALATRYKNNGHVVFNPSNEINCGNGSGQCANATLWASTMTTYINAIRATGALNLILINPTGQGSGNPASGFSMAGVLSVISSGVFTTDPNLAYGIHHYRYPSGGAFSSTNEDTEWGQYLSTYPIVIEECGISPDVVHVYDPDMNGTTSYNLTEWNAFKSEHSDFLTYCRGKMDTDNLSMICCGVDSFGTGNNHMDLTTKRSDGTWTTQGNLVLSNLLNVVTPPTGPTWHTVLTQNPSNPGGIDVNGYNLRVIVPGSVFTNDYTKIRLTLKPSASYPLNFSSMYIGPKASTGDVYDASSFTQLKYLAGNSITMAANSGEYVLDALTITGLTGQAMVLSVAAGGTMRSSYATTIGHTTSYKAAAVSEVATANVAGHTTDTPISAYISKIELYY